MAVSPEARAFALMEQALKLLDEAGQYRAAVHLQWALDIVARVPPMREGDTIDFESDPDEG